MSINWLTPAKAAECRNYAAVVREVHAKRNPALACGLAAGPFREIIAPIETLIRTLALEDSGVTYSAPDEVLCTPTQCSPMLDGALAYKDASHVNATGSRLLGQKFHWPSKWCAQ